MKYGKLRWIPIIGWDTQHTLDGLDRRMIKTEINPVLVGLEEESTLSYAFRQRGSEEFILSPSASSGKIPPKGIPSHSARGTNGPVSLPLSGVYIERSRRAT
jgi:hypothetical protein